MKLSVSSTAFHQLRRENRVVFDPASGISRCAAAGFRALDMNFIYAGQTGRPLQREDWQDWIAGIAQAAEENGVVVSQTHAFWWMKEMSPEEWLQNEAVVFRSLEASAMLGKGIWVTAHTFSRYNENGYDSEATLQYNYDLFCRLGEQAEKLGLGIAVENLFNIAGAIEYSGCAEDLAELMVRLNSPTFGICWDFGHANMAKTDHLTALDVVAPFLRCVHVNDNKAKTDEHGVPFFGTVPWTETMKKLKKIGYNGDLNMTVRSFNQAQSEQVQTQGLCLLHKAGTELVRIFEEAE